MQRGLIVAVSALVYVVLLAPVALAVVAAVAALATDGLAALTIVRLIKDGSLLQTGAAMNALSVASRIGFLAVGYLGLLFALNALLAGLLGRGQGRLFIIPGALLTASALVLLATSVALCWPLLALLNAPGAALIVAALYVALDTVALAMLFADARDVRRWFSVRRSQPAAATALTPETPPAPPTLPPTLAGA
jgi:hypothetical protein